jgi:hypothetical protein
MSIPVNLVELREAVAARGASAYVLTVSDNSQPHAVHACVAWDGDRLAVEVGKRTAANAQARPQMSLLYPLRSDDDYSLIVDGTAIVESRGEGQRLLMTPTKAILHRPAAVPDPDSSCSADCVPLRVPPE